MPYRPPRIPAIEAALRDQRIRLEREAIRERTAERLNVADPDREEDPIDPDQHDEPTYDDAA
jgi:hypothetical protein